MICPHCHKDTDDVSETANIANVSANVQWFDAFWQLYPRKVAKASALKAWKKAATSEAIKDEIMAALKLQLTSYSWRKSREFIPHAATWLNGRRWEDEASGAHKTGAGRAARVIACSYCGDSGIASGIEEDGTRGYRRCSCARGQLPGLMIPSEAQDAF